MSLWGLDIAPKNLTDAEKKEVFVNEKGWVREAGSVLSGNGNANADPEVLVAVGGLPTVIWVLQILQHLEFVNETYDVSAGYVMSVTANFNEAVDVTGTPQLSLTNGNQGSGSGRGPQRTILCKWNRK